MTEKTGKGIALIGAVLSLLWAGAGPVQAAGETMYNYTKIPPFIEVGLNPNLLLLIDNSASMYDPAYDDTTAPGYCNDDSYASASSYGGYFDPATQYYYHLTLKEFKAPAAADQCTTATGTVYSNADLCVTINSVGTPAVNTVTAFAAKGNYLNWATASKFDIEKGILTGGKYDVNGQRLVPESRGCQGKRMIKQVAVTKSDGTAKKLSLGVWPGAGAHDNVTRLEIFLPSDNGLQFAGAACEAALAATAFGQVQNLAGDCLMIGAQHESFANSNAAFNHGFQTCWGYPTIGNGDVTRMESACAKVYDAGVNPKTITANDSGYVCMGDQAANTGYVGRCVTATGGIPATETCTDTACTPNGHPYLGDNNQQCTNGLLEECETGSAWRDPFTTGGCASGTTYKTAQTFYSCPGGYTLNAAQTLCTGTPTCNPGYTLNAAQTACVISSCPVGYYLNAAQTACEKRTCNNPYTLNLADITKCCKTTGPAANPTTTCEASTLLATTPASQAPTSNTLSPTITVIDPTGCYDAVNNYVGPPSATINHPGGCYNGDQSYFWVKKQTCSGGSPATPVDWEWVDDAGDSGGCIETALREYCSGFYSPDVIDPSSPNISVADDHFPNLPAILVTVATNAQLGPPIATLDGYIGKTSAPQGLLQEFSYNLRMGAMRFNKEGTKYECTLANPDRLYVCTSDNRDGGRLVTYIEDNNSSALANAINDTKADAWTPMAEAMEVALGYYTQNSSLRLDNYDFFTGGTASFTTGKSYAAGSVVSYGGQWWRTNLGGTTVGASPGSDAAAGGISDWEVMSYPVWANNTGYSTGAVVSSGGLLYKAASGGTSVGTSALNDTGVTWVPFYDPVVAPCQSNNILIITDGASTSDQAPAMTTFVTSDATHNDGDNDPLDPDGDGRPGCGKNTGSTYLDDLAKYGASANLYYTKNDFVDGDGNAQPKKAIKTYVVAAGTLKNEGAGECNPVALLNETADNGDMDDSKTTTYYASEDPAQLAINLRKVFETIGGEPSSGSAASVISNSRSGEGAIFQAVFFPAQDRGGDRLPFLWSGDVHALWLDELGNIREDTGTDFILDKQVDRILQFYTDPVSSAARANAYDDADGNGHADSTTPAEGNIGLKDIRYLWSAGAWLSEVTAVDDQRAYDGTGMGRHILTSVDGTNMIDFLPSFATSLLGTVRSGLGTDNAYKGYFHAASVDEADDIIGYIRGNDNQLLPDGATSRDYRSRSFDWFGTGAEVIWKLGDIVNSTPTVVSTPAEDYDLVYGDTSYQAFRQRYRQRRAVIYAGGNDGGLHAFNGGYYDRPSNTIEKAPPGKTEYDLGAELWMFVPKNVFPHLKWLTDPNYSHVNYVDFKPYIFDAKIFTVDADHPQGWGTVLVGGMGFGGGNIGVDTDGDGSDDTTMSSSYFVLDITNPEVAPKILTEFTHPGLGYPVGAPTAIPILGCRLKIDCTLPWPMDWYLALPSGPHSYTLPMAALNGLSDETAKIFVLSLGGTTPAAVSLAKTFDIKDYDNRFPKSFFTDVIAVDYDLDFKTDSLYFGSVANADTDQTNQNTGGLHRLVTGESAVTTTWTMNTFFKTPGNQPVSGSPSVASDGSRAWIYFGTGRYYSALLDKPNKAQQSYYGIKEYYDAAGVMDLTQPSDANLVDVSKVWVEKGSGLLHYTDSSIFLSAKDFDTGVLTTLNALTFKALDREMNVKVSDRDKYNGWKLDFDLLGERNLGQAAILGNIVTFTTFVPSENVCKPEGESFLWAPYYRTGTAYSKSVIGYDPANPTEVLRKVSVGVGLASTPNIHSGAEVGSTAFVQTSTGAIISVQQINPGIVKSGMVSWREGCGE